MTTQTIERLAVEVDGSGPAVVMVHGLGGTSNTFTPQMSVFGGRYRVIRPDLPGSGRSRLGGPIAIQRFVDDLVRLIRVLGAEPAHLVGHSLGTIVCQHLAQQQPQLVRSLCLLGAIVEPPPKAREGLRARAAKARADGMADIADQVIEGATSSATKADLPVALAAARESLMRQDPEGYAQTCEALAHATAADLAGVACPTLLIAGEDDAVAPQAMARAIADRVRGARIVVLPRCGHWLTFERAADVNREMKDFFSRQA